MPVSKNKHKKKNNSFGIRKQQRREKALQQNYEQSEERRAFEKYLIENWIDNAVDTTNSK